MSACISVSWTVFGAITMTEIRKHFTLNPIKEEVIFFVMFVYVYVCVRVCVTLTASKSFELILIKKKKKNCVEWAFGYKPLTFGLDAARSLRPT